ncbi:thiamine biosynthesis protein [Actinobaculum suis]|uniref:ABC transporter substrate-binding protein n=1 Tax=Actinobaculum suis TaxID=1657 RepID=UPI00066FDEBD|nr:ABC transporter substrate-binding protein [Actinobaculum suis]KMY23686.1 thiamine biosynthesis protein [Actinobaculum suis]
MKKRLMALVTAAALFLGACGNTSGSSNAEAAKGGQGNTASVGQAAPAGEKITIGLTYVPDVQFAPLYVAEEKGYFAEQGLNIELRHHGAQEGLLTALQGGSEDVVFAGADEMLEGRSNGTDVVNWATMYQQYPVVLIVPEDSPIHSPADLAGRSVGLPGPYGSNYYALQAMLQAYDLTDKVDVQYIGYTQQSALSTGKVDAVVGFLNSDVPAITRQGQPVREIQMMEGGLPLVSVGFGSLAPTLEKHEAEFRKILSALDKAVSFAAENPDETLDITAKEVPALTEPENREAAREVLQRTLQLYTGSRTFGSQDEAKWQAMVEFMNTYVLSQPVAADGAYRELVQD